MRTLEVVVGAQFGSEAKGHVVQRLTERAAQDGRHVQVVRVAGPNAGHTGYDARGQAWALRQVPVAAVTERDAVLGVAAGSEIDLPVLLDEFDRLADAGLLRNKMLWVSGEATLITDNHKYQESGDGAGLIEKIGSTGKGIGAARAGRIMRKAERVFDNDDALREFRNRGIPVVPGGHNPLSNLGSDHHLIIEGTQGYGLGLRAGFYPQCTSSDCRAIDFMAMAGVNPWEFRQTEVWAVARVYPIRVAGNSGPLKDETTWEALGLPEERTTVTKKVRRVGLEDWNLVGQAVRANGGSPTVKVALTMVDQKFPYMANKGYFDESITDDQIRAVRDYIGDVRRKVGADVALITTGPNKGTFL